KVRFQARLNVSEQRGAKHGAEYQPIGTLVLLATSGPTDTGAADQPPIHEDHIGPFEIDQCFGRREHRQRIRKRIHAGINHAARGGQRLVRLEHHGEIDKIEAADPHQRSCAFLGRDFFCVLEGASRLAQRHGPENRRQTDVDFRLTMNASADVRGHSLLAKVDFYSLSLFLPKLKNDRETLFYGKARNCRTTGEDEWRRINASFLYAPANARCRSTPARSAGLVPIARSKPPT